MTETQNQKVWKNCSTCKKPILAGAKYYVCSVSTCNGQRTGYQFCSIQCFESHLPGARHRDAGALEKVAPRVIIANSNTPTASQTASQIVKSASSTQSSVNTSEVLIIASRLKDYIQAKGDMNTSASVMDVLSDFVRYASNQAIDNARADGRKTVMDRDFEFLKNMRF